MLSRSDGPRIGAAHAARLLGLQILNRKQQGAAKRATELALAEVLRHVGLAGIEARAHRAYWTERSNCSSVFVRHELLALFVARRSFEGRDAPDDSADLFGWLRHTLSLSREWEVRDALNDIRQELVAVLRVSTNPREKCKSLFEELETDRRRLEREHAQVGDDSLVPSLLLLVALVELLHAHESPDWLEEISYVRDRALRIALVTVDNGQSLLRAREVIAMCLYVVCTRFGWTDDRTVNFVAPVVADVEAMAHLIERAQKGGDDLQAFIRAMALDAPTMVATARARSEALGTPLAQSVADSIASALVPKQT